MLCLFKGAWLPHTRFVVQVVLGVVPFQGGLVAAYMACSARSAMCSAF